MAKLIVNPTSSSRREILLPRSVLSIGRDPSNDLVLPDAMVSRRHAVIECRGNQFFLRDCNSSNGSLVNGDRVSERNLRDGDLMAIGTARLLFRDEPAAEELGAKVVQHPSAPRLSCPSCGADYRKSDAFCRQCGGPIVQDLPPRAVCTACGTSVALPARFCNACGARLGKDEAAAAPDAPDESAEAAAKPPSPATPMPRRSSVAEEAVAAAAPAPKPAVVAAAPEPPRPRPSAPAVLAERRAPAPQERPVARESWQPAGFGPRLAAGLIDTALVALAQVLLLAPAGVYWWSREVPSSPEQVPFTPILLSLLLLLLVLLLGGAYFVYFWGVRGATPGKAMFDLRVEDEEGGFPIGVAKASGRLFAWLLSAAIFGIGFLMIAAGSPALHDRIAGTRVVRREGA